jgi:hypothetical protein
MRLFRGDNVKASDLKKPKGRNLAFFVTGL